jgi:hypothetical protein
VVAAILVIELLPHNQVIKLLCTCSYGRRIDMMIAAMRAMTVAAIVLLSKIDVTL